MAQNQNPPAAGVPIPYDYDVRGDQVRIRTELAGWGDLHGQLHRRRQFPVGWLAAGPDKAEPGGQEPCWLLRSGSSGSNHASANATSAKGTR